MDLPLPVAEVARRARNAKSPKERHDTAYYAWEASVRLAVAARPPADAGALERPSVGTWVAAAAPPDAPVEEPALAALHARIHEVAHGGRPSARAVSPRRLLEALAAYRNLVIGHGATREPDFYEAGAGALVAAIAPAWRAGLFWPEGARLVHVESVEIDATGARRARVVDLTGFHATVEDPRGTAGLPEGVLPRRLYLRDPRGEWRPLHPWLLYQEAELRERVLFFNGRGRGASYLDYVSGEVVRGKALETAHPGIEAEVERALSSAPSVAGPEPGAAEPEEDADRLGDYRILGKLGAGGMGVVYLARQESLSRLVALKVLPLDAAADDVRLARFKREIAALSRCDHPNVVKILASGERDGAPYYAMELIEGADLAQVSGALSSGADLDTAVSSAAERVRRARRDVFEGVPEMRASRERAAAIVQERPRERTARLARLFRDAARGLAHLHEHGIIHRDVKPGNLMVTAADHRVVVMDLGLAAVADASRSLTRDSTSVLGTLRYMAPEQLQRNLLDVDARADVYALGATFYELLTGRPFLDGDTEARLIQQVLRDEPVPPEKAAPGIPADLATILRKCVEKDPRRRYETAEALAQDVEAMLEGRPIRARPPTLGYILSLTIRNNRLASATGAGALAALVALGVAWERGRVEAHAREVRLREDAEAHRARAEELADFMLFDLADRLRELGRLDMLDEAARKVKGYYDALPEGADSLAKRGGMLGQIGEVLDAKGDVEGARAAFLAAERAFEGRIAAAPEDLGARMGLAAVRLHRGDLSDRLGEPQAGREVLRAAIAVLDAIPPERVNVAEVVALRILVLVRLGCVAEELGDRAGALATLGAARDAALARLRESPGDATFASRLAEVDKAAALVLVESGDTRAAIEQLQSTRALVEGAVRAAPEQHGLTLGLCGLLARLAELEMEEGDLDGALAAALPALERAQALAARDALNAIWEHTLAVAHSTVGRVRQERGEFEPAIEHLRAALAISERNAARDRGNIVAARELLIDEDRLATALLGAGDAAGALALIRRTKQSREKLIARDPGNVAWRMDMFPCLERLGDALAATEDLEGALASYREAMDLADALTREGHGSPGVERRRALLVAASGRVRAMQRDVAGALRDSADAAAALESLLERAPRFGRLRIDLVGTLENRAQVLQVEGRREEARAAAARAVEVVGPLGPKAGSLPLVRRAAALLRSLDVALGRAAPATPREHLALGYALYDAHDLAGSAAAFARALEDPGVRADAECAHLYNGACAASAASAGATVTAQAAEALRAQALAWLGAYMQHCRTRLAEEDADVAQGGDRAGPARVRRARLLATIESARAADEDLASVRGSAEFARLFEGIPRPASSSD